MSEESLRKLATSLRGYYEVMSDPFDMRHCHPCYTESGLTVVLGDQKKRQTASLAKIKGKADRTKLYQDRILEGERRDDPEAVQDPKHPINTIAFYDLPKHFFASQVDIPEWMVDVPSDLADNWLLKPCPYGRRLLLVAHQGVTKVYSIAGRPIASFQSVLPGGGQTTVGGFSTLSCVWSEDDLTYYVLDLLAWNDSLLYPCETDFRFFWLAKKVQEYPGIGLKTKYNDFAIVVLPVISCDKDSLTKIMSIYPMFVGPKPPELHGIQFYHKRSRHGFGATSLSTWLHAFMIKDLLGIEVHPYYMEEKDGHFGRAAYGRELELATRARIASIRTELFVKRRVELTSDKQVPADGTVQQTAKQPGNRSLEHFQMSRSRDKTRDETQADIDEPWQLSCYSASCMECIFVKEFRRQKIRLSEHLSISNRGMVCSTVNLPKEQTTLQDHGIEDENARQTGHPKIDFSGVDSKMKNKPKIHDIG